MPSVLRHSALIIKGSLVHIHHVIDTVEEVLHALGLLLCEDFWGCVVDDAVVAEQAFDSLLDVDTWLLFLLVTSERMALGL